MSKMSHCEIAYKNEAEMLEMARNFVRFETPTHDQVVNDVTIDINKMLEIRETFTSASSRCIYKVPPVIRELNEDAYTPKVVSIGPFHYGDPRLKNMETHKNIFLRRFLGRIEISLEDLVRFVNSLEPRVRACYSENIMLNSQYFTRMILMDTSFIIELFLENSSDGCSDDDAILLQPWLKKELEMDLLKLENQLPFFIFEELFNQVFPNTSSFRKLTFNFFQYHNRHHIKPDQNINIMYFTDLIRIFHLQREKLNMNMRPFYDLKSIDVSFYNAKKLFKAGMFLKGENDACLLNLKYSNGILRIPQITVERETECLFRNLIAFEQLHYPHESYITSYAYILDCLVNTRKDVNVLIHNGIISNYLASSEDVAELFNGLCKGMAIMTFNSDYLDIFKKMEDFMKTPLAKMKATWRSKYGRMSIGGIIITILTLVQTIFSIIR